jgi:hypothetical protein
LNRLQPKALSLLSTAVVSLARGVRQSCLAADALVPAPVPNDTQVRISISGPPHVAAVAQLEWTRLLEGEPGHYFICLDFHHECNR